MKFCFLFRTFSHGKDACNKIESTRSNIPKANARKSNPSRWSIVFVVSKSGRDAGHPQSIQQCNEGQEERISPGGRSWWYYISNGKSYITFQDDSHFTKNYYCLQFDGAEGDNFQRAAAVFCAKQQIALEQLKERRKKDAKLNNFLTEAEGHSMCRRLQLKDMLPTVMQRCPTIELIEWSSPIKIS